MSPNAKTGALIEVNCETDFVGKDANFREFVAGIAETVANTGITDADKIAQQALSSGESVEEKRQALVMKLGENITVRRAALHKAEGKLAHYVHGARIGVIVDVDGGDDVLGKDLAMHIAASKPLAVSREQVSAAAIEREGEFAKARALESGKPQNIVDKIVEGSVKKYLSEITLHGQPFVKDDKISVEKLLASKQARVATFSLFVLGEGIEKKANDFAAEVAAQAAQAH